jgi:hypothetical protein
MVEMIDRNQNLTLRVGQTQVWIVQRMAGQTQWLLKELQTDSWHPALMVGQSHSSRTLAFRMLTMVVQAARRPAAMVVQIQELTAPAAQTLMLVLLAGRTLELVVQAAQKLVEQAGQRMAAQSQL